MGFSKKEKDEDWLTITLNKISCMVNVINSIKDCKLKDSGMKELILHRATTIIHSELCKINNSNDINNF